jgi:zinc transporter
MSDFEPNPRRTIQQLDPACPPPPAPDAVPDARQADGLIWVHLHDPGEPDRQWLQDVAGLDRDIVDMLTEQDTRPRIETRNDGTLLILRGLNLNPDSDPDDMVAIRIWLEAHRVFTVTSRGLAALLEMQQRAAEGKAPRRAGAFCATMCGSMVARIGAFTNDLEDRVDELEDDLLDESTPPPLQAVALLRRQIIRIRRFLHPQSAVLRNLPEARMSWMERVDRTNLAKTAHLALRYAEDLDASRDRTSILQDQILAHMSTSMNRIMVLLSMVAVVFLPLTFLTGLLGMNVQGIPYAEHSQAFAGVCALLALLGGFLVVLLRRWRWP